jgi:hypothetical protein
MVQASSTFCWLADIREIFESNSTMPAFGHRLLQGREAYKRGAILTRKMASPPSVVFPSRVPLDFHPYRPKFRGTVGSAAEWGASMLRVTGIGAEQMWRGESGTE